jgi:ubiquitin carboxyl-terminal hydrolase L3
MHYKKHFVPLESDPEIFTDLMRNLGVAPSFRFIDVWSLEDSVLAFIPRPVLALVLVLPNCPAYEEQFAQGQTVGVSDGAVFWLKQTIHNACGLYAILHAVCNRPEVIGMCQRGSQD